MNTKDNIANELKDYNNKRKEQLLKRGTNMTIFEVEGSFYIGKLEDAIDRFIYNNPRLADFSVYLQKNYKEVKIML